mmetsp:Transcript_36622/g.66400  ORF Transcript_36622/g.66400 Transcript_36622/m.66400 type:complete len:190 (-) Transcript_36622:146-715(-)
MVRTVLFALALLGAASEEVQLPLADDDVCDGSESCSLELKQLRAQKVSEHAQDGQNCMNHQDQRIFTDKEKVNFHGKSKSAFTVGMAQCGRQCMDKHTGSVDGPCTSECMTKNSPVSTPQCGKCFGIFAECGSEKCKSCQKKIPCKHTFKKCASGEMDFHWVMRKSCMSCMNEKCGKDFEACAGQAPPA